MARTDLDALVIGAGVSGLTTAICLAESGRRVKIWAAELPEQTTSYAAGQCGAHTSLNPSTGYASGAPRHSTCCGSSPPIW
ncbi:FAD-dependent oxidoreductase [Plantactinospora sp. WMMC1484]|uniref:FAD-dependent oxidoreductase n=1 Tax=Plantactinospora sp. WMMC1484 TaxID=3404122 RepID=UPI003BF4F600